MEPALKNDDKHPEREGRIRQKNMKVILAAAEEEFVRNGFSGASIQGIANRSGFSKANILYYFGNKDGLYRAVLSGILDLWWSACEVLDPEAEPEQALAQYIAAKVEYSRKYPKASRIFASEVIHGAPHIAKHLREEGSEWLEKFSAVIQSWIDQGKMDPVDPVYLLFLIWGATQHYADFGAQVTRLTGKKLTKGDYGDITDTLTQIVLKGCGIR